MIPADLANRLRLALPPAQQDTLQPVQSIQKLTDVLSNLVPGQRILAEVQAMLPNGTYRAIVAQRDVTLALPFSAKAGDSLELEVLDSDGKITLAFVANRTAGQQAAAQPRESVPTTLSQTGRLIGNLMGNVEDAGAKVAPASLNGNQPLLRGAPDAAQLAPILKEALSKSGVFYEAHQARWLAGQLPTDSLRQEPQAKFSPAPVPVTVNVFFDPKNSVASTSLSAEKSAQNLQNTLSNKGAGSADRLVQLKLNSNYNNLGLNGDLEVAVPPATNSASISSPQQFDVIDKTKPDVSAPTVQTNQRAEQATNNTQPGNPIPRELTPIVQQQLDGLANQNFAWQGEVWPGQKMHWEIGENAANPRGESSEVVQWQTRLKLSLPMLGGIDAILQLRPDGEIGIKINIDSEVSTTRLRGSTNQLREQFESAGLNLTQLLLQHGQPAE